MSILQFDLSKTNVVQRYSRQPVKIKVRLNLEDTAAEIYYYCSAERTHCTPIKIQTLFFN